jgi:hypothetical protein
MEQDNFPVFDFLAMKADGGGDLVYFFFMSALLFGSIVATLSAYLSTNGSLSLKQNVLSATTHLLPEHVSTPFLSM